MDKKSQKLVLLTMAMNSAHNLKIKFTNSKIVNLALYASVSIYFNVKYDKRKFVLF